MFDSTTQAQEVAAAFHGEISGKTFVITGVGFGGLGAAVCEALAPYRPGLLIITGRDIQRPKAVAEALVAQYADLKISVIQMDLALTKSVENALSPSRALNSRTGPCTILMSASSMQNNPVLPSSPLDSSALRFVAG
ncbi:retinol dehydrogenase 13 [Fusarium mundagurra]|uniref:Retinol dehydrogenase 13 n=1 Tax=Fusarium mundagurra TaxID=1567541 RepID=A0A8H5YNW1_9HYPO|nr:retinol dehydrogenase 13 [Fusarium mundagurra]